MARIIKQKLLKIQQRFAPHYRTKLEYDYYEVGCMVENNRLPQAVETKHKRKYRRLRNAIWNIQNYRKDWDLPF